MKNIKQILILVKKEYNMSYHSGLCSVVDDLWYSGKITHSEKWLFIDYLTKTTGKQISGYIWIIGTTKGRNRWLNKHIKLNL